jgi:hypothetical protein
MILETEYLRVLAPEIKMTEVDVRKLMLGHCFETHTSSGKRVSFCAMNGLKVKGNGTWTAHAKRLFSAMWVYLKDKNSIEYEQEEWAESHVVAMRHASFGHRYWFLLEEVEGNLSVVAYVHFDFKPGVGLYIVHILCQSSGWNATHALTAIAIEKAARNNAALVFLNFTGEHLKKIYTRCGFVSPPPEVAPLVEQFTDAVHNQVLVKILESKPVVEKAKTALGTRMRVIGPASVVVGYAAPATADDSDALLSAAPTPASSPACAEFSSPGDRGKAQTLQ